MHIICYTSCIFAHQERIFHGVFCKSVAQQIGNYHNISKESQNAFKNKQGITPGSEFINICGWQEMQYPPGPSVKWPHNDPGRYYAISLGIYSIIGNGRNTDFHFD